MDNPLTWRSVSRAALLIARPLIEIEIALEEIKMPLLENSGIEDFWSVLADAGYSKDDLNCRKLKTPNRPLESMSVVVRPLSEGSRPQ